MNALGREGTACLDPGGEVESRPGAHRGEAGSAWSVGGGDARQEVSPAACMPDCDDSAYKKGHPQSLDPRMAT